MIDNDCRLFPGSDWFQYLLVESCRCPLQLYNFRTGGNSRNTFYCMIVIAQIIPVTKTIYSKRCPALVRGEIKAFEGTSQGTRKVEHSRDKAHNE